VIKYALVVTIILVSSFSCVAESQALVIGPSRFEVRLPAGEVASADYYVQNDDEAAIHVTVEPENWFAGNYDYKGLTAKDWIKCDVYEFDLKPREIKKVVVTIMVPKKASGELAAQIFFSSNSLESGGMRMRLGGILYVAIKDTEKINAEIRNMGIAEITSGGKRQVKISADVVNTGNIHVRPASGQVFIENNKGERISQLNVLTEQPVLPKDHFTYNTMWDPPVLEKGIYRVSASIKYGKMYGREKTAKSESSFEVDDSGKVIAK